MTPAQIKATLEDVIARAKGWPVGIPVPEADAKYLVAQGWCEWAPPAFTYCLPVFAVRVTSAGHAHLKHGLSDA